jgi:formylglycine-generating enzyme required for sulfatase activity
MKSYLSSTALSISLLLFTPAALRAQTQFASQVYESPRELYGVVDFDGDGRADVIIVDKETGKYRLGYQSAPGTFSWVDCRPGGMKGITGMTIGHLLDTNRNAVAFASPDDNKLVIVGAANPTAVSRPVVVPFTAALGPNVLAAVDVDGAGNTPLADLFVGSIYNSPDPSQGTLVRNDQREFSKIADIALAGVATRANHLALQPGQPEVVAELVDVDSKDTLSLTDFHTGSAVEVAAVKDLPAHSDYAIGNFRGTALPEFLIYKPGDSKLSVYPVEEAGGKARLGKVATYDLGQPVRRVVALNNDGKPRLFVIFGEGEKAGLFNFDGVKAPVAGPAIVSTNGLINFAVAVPGGLVAVLQPAGGKFSNRYQVFKKSGDTYEPSTFGSLASLADNDNITIPDIYARIVAAAAVTNEAAMKIYTNSIPGTHATYVMVPIPSGEYTMGSPASEPGRKPDEGPQHKVKISPFWMGQCEITWNEYELFMYPDEEKRTRATMPSDAAADKLADAVTHPSKPYVEMSFGMGKDGFPAIAMTQHAANKYCQWLSAKTGQFYRLPTEAEWEYACRAGTTTTFSFGDDIKKLPEYAWFEQNSDFKYQKVGRKKANPWGLYDMYGNVVEWVLDQYDPDYYQKCADLGTVTNPWNKATKSYPLAVRGGSWDDEAVMCRSAARRGSERAWKMQDPQLPKSIWYFSDAQFVGFRIIRPLVVPSPEEMQKYWSSGVERD